MKSLYLIFVFSIFMPAYEIIGQIGYFEKFDNLNGKEEAVTTIFKINESEAILFSTGEVEAEDEGWHMIMRKVNNSNGQMVLKKDYSPFLNYSISPEKVIKNELGNYIVTGLIDNKVDPIFLGGNTFICEINENAEVLWATSIGDSDLRQWGKSITQVEDEGYIITGWKYKNMNSNSTEAFVLKTTIQGDSLWTKIFADDDGSKWKGVIVEKGDNNSVYMAFNRSNDSFPWAHVVKLDATTGETIWNNQYMLGLSNGIVGSSLSEDGELVLSRTILEEDGNCTTWGLMKIDADGNILWDYSYEQEIGCANGNRIIRTNEGGYATCLRQNYPKLVVVDSKGNYLYSKTYEIEPFMSPKDLVQLEDGSFLIVGYEGATSEYTTWLIKTDPQGDLVLSVGKEIEQISVSIYPNPSTSYIKIDLPQDGKRYTAKLANSTGVLLDTYSVSELNQTISIEHLANGLYYLNVFEKNKIVAIKKVLKQ